MDEKKGKALAAELIDDLLEDEDQELNKSNQPKKTAQNLQPVDYATSDSDVYDFADEHTVPLSESQITTPPDSKDEMKATAERFASPEESSGSLAQSENLRLAQQKIIELEKEIERLRLENEQLAAAGETLRRKADEMFKKYDDIQKKYDHSKDEFSEERELLKKSLDNKEKENRELRLKIEELESRLSTNIQKIRVRERELENRLEIVKMENASLIRGKDEVILDLKRQVDQLNIELDNYRTKGQDLNKQVQDKQEMLRRTVKALRIALSMLENNDDGSNHDEGGHHEG